MCHGDGVRPTVDPFHFPRAFASGHVANHNRLNVMMGDPRHAVTANSFVHEGCLIDHCIVIDHNAAAINVINFMAGSSEMAWMRVLEMRVGNKGERILVQSELKCGRNVSMPEG
jgi:hypothetical protein